MIGIAVAIDLARAAQSRPLAGDLTAAELVASEDLFLGSQVRALTVTLAEKDEYTERHTRRVALRAVQVGDELGLSRSRLRTLAIGGLVHDIGKLAIPDEILKKPGPLDDDEYATVKEHAERGYRLLTELGGFGEGVRDLVRDHHERLDGKGYPRGLTAAQLTLDARILAVCDVYDALISKRVYRDAWSEQNAIDYLRAETGTAFDERCVEALARVVGREPARAPAPRRRARRSDHLGAQTRRRQRSNTSSTSGRFPCGTSTNSDVARLDPRAAARRDRVVAANDDGDERFAREAELADGRARDRVVGGDAELLQVERPRLASRRAAAATGAGGADQPQSSREPLERRALQHDRDEDDEEHRVEDRVGGRGGVTRGRTSRARSGRRRAARPSRGARVRGR